MFYEANDCVIAETEVGDIVVAFSQYIAKKDLLPGRERHTYKVLSNKSYLNNIINLQSQRSRY